MGAKHVGTYNIKLYEKYLTPYLNSSLEPAEMNHDVPLIHYPEVDDFFLNCAVAQTPGGRIYSVYFDNEDGDDASAIFCWSDDGGKTFSVPKFILDPGIIPGTAVHRSCICGQLWCDPEGRLWFFYMQSVGYFDGRGGSWVVRCDNPDSDAPVWGRSRRIWHGTPMTKPIVLEDGSYLTLISLWGREKIGIQVNKNYVCGLNSSLYHELDSERKIYAFISRDKGETWEKLGGICPSPEIRDFDEPSVVQRNDGSLIMLMRTVTGIQRSVSLDMGRTWSEPELLENVPCATSNFFFTKLLSGHLLLVTNSFILPNDGGLNNRQELLAIRQDEIRARRNMTAFLSCDGGISWCGKLLLDDRQSSYPDGFQTSDGRIFITYDQKRRGGRLVLCSFREEDVAACKPVSSDALFKHTIIRSASAIAEEDGCGPVTGYIKFF